MNKKWVVLAITIILAFTTIFTVGCGEDSQKEDTENNQTVTDESETEDSTVQKEDEQQDNADAEGATEYPLTITDSLGNEVTIEAEPERVISLAPADTEILFALGAGDRVKGRTDYCSYPEEAAEVESIGTYTSPNTELIISLEPDVIFASDYMDDSIRSQVEAAGAKVVVFSANTVESVQDIIIQAGLILNLNQNAKGLVDSMSSSLKEVKEVIASNEEEKSVFVDIGSFYSAGPGSLMDDMLNQIGVENIAADTGEAYPQLSVETIIEKNPDIYISLYSTEEEIQEISGLNELDCVKNGNIIFFEALSYEADIIQRPSPRVVDGIKLLAEKIYPDLFN